jgi:hypothetical protein
MRIRVIAFIFFVSMAFFVVSDASSWEGAAATSPEGELPANGLYVATNSFPRNTVVDIVNIETNKSTRAIVAAGLDSPGLLAIVSREVAEIIGMRPGSISRIRITQPSDPIAYLRFMESLAAGIPPYDSGNVITEETYWWDDTSSESSATGSDTPAAEPAQTRVGALPPYFLEPEWGGISPRDIIDLPSAPSLTAGSGEPSAENIADLNPEEKEVSLEIVESIPEEEAPQEIAEYTEEETPQQITGIPEEETPQQITEYTPEEEQKEETYEIVEQPQPVDTERVTQYNIVPSQERPPQGNIYGINPADIIPQITRVNVVEPARELILEPMIESIPAIERTPVPQRAPVVSDTNFSIPRIYELARGSYYVQLTAVDTPESVESAVSLIDRNYGPVVYKDSDNWYRILLGPLNQGESAAVLQRFRSIGYRDAFVRYVR